MPVVSRFFGIVIVFHWEDHVPPHFHANYGGDEALIEIRTGAVVRGSLPRRVLALVEEWRAERVKELLDDWECARLRKPLSYIAPLE